MNEGEDFRGPTDPEGRLYGRPKARPDEVLVHCGPGTPGGELLRRYWQPLALASEATERPRLVKILDEELILFRDRSGKPGLLYPRCMHRGTSLLFGRVEQDGIRCPYHGWKFEVTGRCIDMACEPGVKPPASARQPWYPLMERYGLLFTYMGPPDRQPCFPRFSLCEGLGPDEEVVPRGAVSSKLIGGLLEDDSPIRLETDYNWWNFHDNVIDPFHLYWLHSNLNGIQFVDTWKMLPRVKYERTRDGVRCVQYRDPGDGFVHLRVGQSFMPNMHGIGAVNDTPGRCGMGWAVPVDDTNFRTFNLWRLKKGENPTDWFFKGAAIFEGRWGPGKPASEYTLEDRQDWASDYECQKSQGDFNLHSEEHLRAALDGGLAMVRQMFRDQAHIVARGGNPIGVTFDEPYLYEVTASVALLDPTTLKCVAGFDGRETAEKSASAGDVAAT